MAHNELISFKTTSAEAAQWKNRSYITKRSAKLKCLRYNDSKVAKAHLLACPLPSKRRSHVRTKSRNEKMLLELTVQGGKFAAQTGRIVLNRGPIVYKRSM